MLSQVSSDADLTVKERVTDTQDAALAEAIILHLSPPVHSTQEVNTLLQAHLKDTSSETEKAVGNIMSYAMQVCGILDSMGELLDVGIGRAEQLREQSDTAVGQLHDQALAVDADYIDQLFARYQDISGDQMVELKKSVSALDAPVMEIIAALQFQDIARQRMEQMEHALDYVNTQFDIMLLQLSEPDGVEKLQQFNLKEVFNGYCMASQRRVHAEVTGGAGDADELPDIDLF